MQNLRPLVKEVPDRDRLGGETEQSDTSDSKLLSVMQSAVRDSHEKQRPDSVSCTHAMRCSDSCRVFLYFENRRAFMGLGSKARRISDGLIDQVACGDARHCDSCDKIVGDLISRSAISIECP